MPCTLSATVLALVLLLDCTVLALFAKSFPRKGALDARRGLHGMPQRLA
jgi:hypothetical protein